MADEGNPVSKRKGSRNSLPSVAASGSNSTLPANGSSKKRNSAIVSSKSGSATTGRKCKTQRGCEESKEADCDAVPVKKKRWNESSKEGGSSSETIWSQLGAKKCDKCGFTSTDEGVFNSHVCSTKRLARTLAPPNLPRPISRGAFSVSPGTNLSQSSAQPVQTTCSSTVVCAVIFNPPIVSSTPCVPFVCSSETVCPPLPLTNSTESNLKNRAVLLCKSPQTLVCSSETAVTKPPPVTSSSGPKTGELRADVPAVPLQAAVCSETVCAPTPVKSTAGQPVPAVPLQAAVCSEAVCAPTPVKSTAGQPVPAVPLQAAVCSETVVCAPIPVKSTAGQPVPAVPLQAAVCSETVVCAPIPVKSTAGQPVPAVPLQAAVCSETVVCAPIPVKSTAGQPVPAVPLQAAVCSETVVCAPIPVKSTAGQPVPAVPLQAAVCSETVVCAPIPVKSTAGQPVPAVPLQAAVCSEAVCAPTPVKSTAGQPVPALPLQAAVCSEAVCAPTPVKSTAGQPVPAVPLQAAVCSEAVCAPTPVKSTAGQPGHDASSGPLQAAAAFSSETACTPSPVTGSSVQPGDEVHSVPPQATVSHAKSVPPAASRSESERRQQGTPQTVSQSNRQGTEKSQQRRGFIEYDQNTQRYICMQCRYSAAQGNSLSEHLIYQISANPYNCRLCNIGYATRSDFQNHFLQSHPGKKMECELRRVKEVKKILSKAREAAMSGKPHAFLLHPEFKDCIKQSTCSATPKAASLSQGAPRCSNSSLTTPQMPSTSVCSQTNSCKAVEDQNRSVNGSEKFCNSASLNPLHDDNHCSFASQKSQAGLSAQNLSSEQNVQALNESEISKDQPDHVPSSESRTADNFHSRQHSSCTPDAAAEQTKTSQQEQCVTTPPFSTGCALISTDLAQKEPHTDVVQPGVKAGKQSTDSSTQSSGVSGNMARNMPQSKTGIENTMSVSDNQVAQEKGSVPNRPRPVERVDSKIASQRVSLPVSSVETADAGILSQGLYSPVSSFASTSPKSDAGIVPQRLYSPISSISSISPDNLSVPEPLSPFPASSDQTCSAVTSPPVSTPAAAFVPISPPSVHQPPAAVSPVSPPPVDRPPAAFSPVTPLQIPHAAVSPFAHPPVLSPQITLSQTIPPPMPPAAASSITHLAVTTPADSSRALFSQGTPPPVLSPHATVSPVEPLPAVSPITLPPVSAPPAAVSPVTPSPVYTGADPGQPVNVSISEQAGHFELRAQTGKECAASSPSLHRQEVAELDPQSGDGASCSSTGVGHQTAQDKGNHVLSQSNASKDSFSSDDSSVSSLCSNYFVKFFNTFACLPCGKRLTNKEMFYDHVWDHLHADGQRCNMCRNTSEKQCVRTKEMVDSVSSVVDGKLLLKLKDNCRRRLSLKLAAKNNSLLNGHNGESESPASTTSLDAQLSGSLMHVDAQTDQNVQEGSCESVQQLNVCPTAVHPATEDVSSVSESTLGTGQVGERVTDFEEQNVRNSPVLLSTVSRNEMEQEHGSNDRQILDDGEPEQENGPDNGQTSTGNGLQESDLVNRQRRSEKEAEQDSGSVDRQDAPENEVEQEPGPADRGVSVTPVNDQGGQLEQVAEDFPSEKHSSSCNPPGTSESISQAGHESSEESCSKTDLDNRKEAEEANAHLEENANLDVCHASSHLGTASSMPNGGRNTEREGGSETVRANSTMQQSEDSRTNEKNNLDAEGERPQSKGSKSSTTNSVFYICSLCNFSCATAIDFTFHLNFHHHHEPSFPCYHCNYQGKYTTDLSNHMSDHTAGDSNIFVCPCCDKCSYTTNSLPGLRQHLETHKDCQTFRCRRCETTFNDSMGFIQHLERDMITLSTCSQCDSRFVDKTAMQHHWRTAHSGGLVIKVQKILLCLERKTNDYWTTRSREQMREDDSVDDDQVSTVKSLPSVPAQNLELDKLEGDGQVTEDQSGVLVLGQVSASKTVVEEEKGSASEARREGSSFPEISGEPALRNDSALSDNVPESAEKTVDDGALSTQKEPSSVFLSKGESWSDQNEAASSHLDVGDESEGEAGATEMIRNQSNLADGASITDQPVSVTSHGATADGHTVENKSRDCHQESWQPWQRNAPANQGTSASSVTSEQASTSASDHETALPSECSDTNSTHLLPSEVPERGDIPASDGADTPTKDKQEMTKLTTLFGSRELHRVLSDQLYHENASQFCCVFCEKHFNRLANIHRHLFTHFHVPLFSCVFCFYKSESQRDLKRHNREEHPQEKCAINCLMVDRDHLLKTLEKAKPSTITEFKTICQKFKDGNTDSDENRLDLDPRAEENKEPTAREEAEVINRAHDGNHESDTTIGTTPLCAAGHGDISREKPSAAEKTVPSDRSETSSTAKESETVKQIDSPESSNGATVVPREKVDKDPPSDTTAVSSRTENESADSEAKASRLASGKRHCEEKSFRRSTSAPQRKNAEEKGFKDVSECHEPNEGKGSKKKKSSVGPKRGTTYTIEKGKFLSKYKCKACNYKALCVNSVIKHQQTCQRFINVLSVSEQTDFAGLLAKQLHRTQTPARTFHVTGQKDTASVQSKKASKTLSGSESSGSDSEISNPCEKSKRQLHSKKKVQRLSPKDAKSVKKTPSLKSGKSRLAEEVHETVLKETGQAENVSDAFSSGPKRRKKEPVSKDVGGDAVGVNSAEDESDVAKNEEDDFSLRRPKKRRAARILESSSDENDSREERGNDKNLEMEKENRTGIEPEEMAQCKLCDFAAPSSQVNELQAHLDCKHKRLAVLMKCGYCCAPYGNATILKKHINSVHHGLPVFQERVPYGEFYRVLEKGKCPPKTPIKQQAGKIRSEPCNKRSRAQSPILILDDEEVETEDSGKHKEGKTESKTVDCQTGRSSLPTPKQTGSSLNSKHSSQKIRSDNSVSSASKKTSHGEKDGTHRAEPLGSSSVDDTDLPPDTSTKAAAPGSEKTGCGEKESGQKQSSTSDVKNKAKGSLREKQRRDDKGKDSSSSKRYHCVKCTQVHSDYRNIFLHMSRHLKYSPYRCGLCHMEFFTADEVKVHHDKKHHKESFSQSGVYDREVEEEIARLVRVSLVEGGDRPQGSAQDTEDRDKTKQAIQCCSCQAEQESLIVLKRHCNEEHGLVSKAKILWKDVASQVVYNLHGQPVDGKTASQVHVLPYLCGFCSLRFKSRESATAHSQKKHSEKKHGWIVQLRSSSSSPPASLETPPGDGSVPAAGSQKKGSEAEKASPSRSVRDAVQNSSASSAESSRDSLPGPSSSKNVLKKKSLIKVALDTPCKRRRLVDAAMKAKPVVVLTDLFKTDRIDEVLLINGISSIHVGDNLSDEMRAFFMKFVPQ